MERVKTIATFLQEVNGASDEERQSEAFQRRVWERSPLYDLGPKAADGDLTKHLPDAEFRRWFHELVVRPLPKDPQRRAERLDDHIGETMDRVKGDPPAKGPHTKTTRAFAAFFPHDFTAHRSPGLKDKLYALLTGRKRPAKPASMKPATVDVEWAGV